MAPHRQNRITLLIIAFAAQIPALMALMIFGASTDYAPLVGLLPAAALLFCVLSKTKTP